jgi:hypothetical protein
MGGPYALYVGLANSAYGLDDEAVECGGYTALGGACGVGVGGGENSGEE